MKNFTSGHLIDAEGLSPLLRRAIAASTDARIAQYEIPISTPPPITAAPATQLRRASPYSTATATQLVAVLRAIRSSTLV